MKREPVDQCGRRRCFVLLALVEADDPHPRRMAHGEPVTFCRDLAPIHDGLTMRHPARVGIIGLDEGEEDEASPPAALIDRLAFHVDLAGLAPSRLA